MICHGPQKLVAAGVLKGRRSTSYPAVGCDVTNWRRGICANPRVPGDDRRQYGLRSRLARSPRLDVKVSNIYGCKDRIVEHLSFVSKTAVVNTVVFLWAYSSGEIVSQV